MLDDFALEDSDEEKFSVDDVEQAKTVTKDLNLMKLTSTQLLEEAKKREAEVLAGDEGSDKYIPMNQVKDTINNLEKRYSVEIEHASETADKERLSKL